MSCGCASVVLISLLLGTDLPADFTLPGPPGPYVGASASGSSPTLGLRRGSPLVATTYFYWYDAATKAHVGGKDALTDHPPTLDDFSYKSTNWHAAQLNDMIVAGIDVAMPVYWGLPQGGNTWSDRGLSPLVAARERLLADGKRPPAIGMFYDTSTLQANGRGYHVDLTTPAGKLWFYGTIRNFYSGIPPAHRATIDGKPLVFLYTAAFAQRVDGSLFPEVRKMFRRDFGSDLYLVKMRDWPGQADSEYRWGGAVWPQWFDTASLGPGYDHSALRDRDPLIRRRDGGRFYEFSWQCLLARDPAARPWLVHLETWNEFHEGTDLCQSAEYGRKYIALTRKFADQFHERQQSPASAIPPAIDGVYATPERSEGLEIRPRPRGDGPVVDRTVAGRRTWSTTRNRCGTAARYLYFDVQDYSVHDGENATELTVTYFDGGPKSFCIQYDSRESAGNNAQQFFREQRTQPITRSGKWKDVVFTLRHAQFCGYTSGVSFRIACQDADLLIARIALHRKHHDG
jgi:hypothetical protein